MPLNQRLLRTVVYKEPSVQRFVIAKARPLIELDYETKKEQFLVAFDEHPVSQELEAGPEAFSSIPALASAGGNLFSLLGFFSSQRPIKALRDILDENITLGRTKAGVVRGNKVTFTTPVKFPTIAEVNQKVASNEETQLEWTGRSFTDLIARGISGLPNYLFDLTRGWDYPPSRSGTAVQTHDKPLRGGSVGKIDYVNELLGVFKSLFARKR